MKEVLVRNNKIKYNQKGYGEELVFINSLGASCKEFEGFLTELESDFRVTSLDVIGLSYLRNPPRNVREVGQLVKDTCDELELNPSVIVGHSYGGLVALTEPVNSKKIIAINPPLPTLTDSETYIWKAFFAGLRLTLRPQLDFNLWTHGICSSLRYSSNFLKNQSNIRELIKDIKKFPYGSLNPEAEVHIIVGTQDEITKISPRLENELRKIGNIHKIRARHAWPMFEKEEGKNLVLKVLNGKHI